MSRGGPLSPWPPLAGCSVYCSRRHGRPCHRLVRDAVADVLGVVPVGETARDGGKACKVRNIRARMLHGQDVAGQGVIIILSLPVLHGYHTFSASSMALAWFPLAYGFFFLLEPKRRRSLKSAPTLSYFLFFWGVPYYSYRPQNHILIINALAYITLKGSIRWQRF